MGNQHAATIQNHKINFEDMQKAVKQRELCTLIHTLPVYEQKCLILGTLLAEEEEARINGLLQQKSFQKQIVLYGRNCHDETCMKKYQQLVGLGFSNVYMYSGGMFEWLLLQEIYGHDEFPTTEKFLDLLKYKPPAKLQINLLTY